MGRRAAGRHDAGRTALSPGAKAKREPIATALPWAKWYPRELLGDVIAHGLTFEDVGLLVVLRALQDANDGLPVSLPEIRAMLPRRVAPRRLQGVLDLYFPVAPTGDYRRDEQFHQQRVEARETHAAKVQAGRDGAAKRRGAQQPVDAAAASDQEDGASTAALRTPPARIPTDSERNSSPNGTASGSANGTTSGRTSPGANGNQKKKENQNQSQTSTPPPDSSPSSVVGARATPAEVPSLDRLLQRLTTSAEELAIRAFLERCPEQEQLAWTQRLAGYLQGTGLPRRHAADARAAGAGL